MLCAPVFRKQQKIVNVQNEKADGYESARMTAMAEMKFVENKLQSFDLNAKPTVTHTQIEKLQKVGLREEGDESARIRSVGCGQHAVRVRNSPATDQTLDAL